MNAPYPNSSSTQRSPIVVQSIPNHPRSSAVPVQLPYCGQNQTYQIINTNGPVMHQPIQPNLPHMTPQNQVFGNNFGRKPMPKISGTFSFEPTMNQNVLQMKAQFSIEGIGTLPIISLPTRSLKSGFDSLETELKKWI